MRLFLPVTRSVGSARKASTLLIRPNYPRRAPREPAASLKKLRKIHTESRRSRETSQACLDLSAPEAEVRRRSNSGRSGSVTWERWRRAYRGPVPAPWTGGRFACASGTLSWIDTVLGGGVVRSGCRGEGVGPVGRTEWPARCPPALQFWDRTFWRNQKPLPPHGL